MQLVDPIIVGYSAEYLVIVHVIVPIVSHIADWWHSHESVSVFELGPMFADLLFLPVVTMHITKHTGFKHTLKEAMKETVNEAFL